MSGLDERTDTFFCEKCGDEYEDITNFCEYCGYCNSCCDCPSYMCRKCGGTTFIREETYRTVARAEINASSDVDLDFTSDMELIDYDVWECANCGAKAPRDVDLIVPLRRRF